MVFHSGKPAADVGNTMKRIFAVLPTVVVVSGIAGWAVARTNLAGRVEERARIETQAVRMESERTSRRLVDLLASADRVIVSRRPESGGNVESAQAHGWVSRLAQIVGRAEITARNTWSLWVSDTDLTCYRGSEKILWMMPLGRVWKISAGDRSGDFIVNEAAGAAIDALLREAPPRPVSS